ncbi:MAG: DNA mismatch repair protein MutS [Psychroflexus sp.]|nr:DNA mismatch repair protein MutS [Psychroflexus sp.]
MGKITNKVLTDLEYPQVCQQLSEYCVTTSGKEKALVYQPFDKKRSLFFHLDMVEEYKSSQYQDHSIPNHGFDNIDHALDQLNIENNRLELISFRKIKTLSETANEQIRFFNKHKGLYPRLHQLSSQVQLTDEIVDTIELVIDKFGEIRNNASARLADIRAQLNDVRSKIGSSFTRALQKYQQDDVLADIKESTLENRRVLAVRSMYKKRVDGKVMGHSKTGSIVFMQPSSTQKYDREFNHLLYEEDEEIKRILLWLTDFIRPHKELLKSYTQILTQIDIISAKVKYAELYNGIKPQITKEQHIELVDAYHPLLLIDNNKKQEKTYPQDIKLDKEQQIIVISGPNAGGKSITLKTVGILQLMLQSAMLIPVHEYSRMCIFDQLLTDIGDNQSIADHLSTYSYRLKNMRNFINNCNAQTLFLIDEFGTGTDPELGGALAEACLEEFFEKKAYGIITTHYANLKMLANDTPGIVNANMMFDRKTLLPTFQLQLGEAGSSFTFEVAQKNGIPYRLINRAKKKVERGKVRFDKSIAKLQTERHKLSRETETYQKKQRDIHEKEQEYRDINEKIKDKLERYQELYDANQQLIRLGEKINQLIEVFLSQQNKKSLMSNFMKIVEKEKAKKLQNSKKERKKQQNKQKKTRQEVSKKVDKIRDNKKTKEKSAPKKPEPPKPVIKVKDRVKMEDGKAVGTVEAFKKDKAVVNYGAFTTTISPDQLEKVK